MGKAPAANKAERPTSNVQRPTPKLEQPVTAAVARKDNDSLDLNDLWQKTLEQVGKRRPLIKGWIDSAKVLGQEGRSLLLGFPPEQKTAMESIATPRNREFLEALLKEISGRDWTLKLSLKDGLVVEAPKETTPTTTKNARDDFKDDPLIREALEIFKGEIKS